MNMSAPLGLLRLVLFSLLLASAALIAAGGMMMNSPDQEGEILTVYRQFAAAQNRHDLPAIRSYLVDTPDFLWVTDGVSIWGIDEAIARMGQIQKAGVWQVEPDLGAAVPIILDKDTAFLNLPLTLVNGPVSSPQRFQYLMNIVWVKKPNGWRIAALFTTTRRVEERFLTAERAASCPPGPCRN